MPKTKTNVIPEAKRSATARLYAEMAGHDPDEALKEGAGGKPAPAKKPKTGAKQRKG